MSFNPGGGGGGGSISASSDVQLSNPVSNNFLSYDSGTQKWSNKTAAQAGVVAVGQAGLDRAYKVYWNKQTQSWGTVPGTLPSGYDVVEYISTNDAAATAPTPPPGADAWLWTVAPGGGPA